MEFEQCKILEVKGLFYVFTNEGEFVDGPFQMVSAANMRAIAFENEDIAKRTSEDGRKDSFGKVQ